MTTSVTNKVLENYMEKCVKGQEQISAALEKARADVEFYEKQAAVIYGQIKTIEYLMDNDEVVPVVEVPIVDEEAMDAAHEKRLSMFDDTTPEEFFKGRQNSVYKNEAMDFVETIDAINNEEAE